MWRKKWVIPADTVKPADERPLVSLFTRPRRFGKTLNMDMLRAFFERSEVDHSPGRVQVSKLRLEKVKFVKGESSMFPTINVKETGANLRRIMDKRGITAKEVQKYLNLASVQSVYYWWNGTNMPTIDNLYALSQLLRVPIDEIVCGNGKAILPKPIVLGTPCERRLYTYYKKIYEMQAA